MSTEFRAAVRDGLPSATIVADHWHVATRTNLMVAAARLLLVRSREPGASAASWAIVLPGRRARPLACH
jgi:hypothetical protein